MHILFDSHALNEFGESEAYQAYCIVRAAAEYARVSVLVPERWIDSVPSLNALGVNVIPVRYDPWALPADGSLGYTYWLYSRRAHDAARDVLHDVDLVHRLNPNAVRYASSLAFAERPFIIGPLGWSTLPPAWSRAPAAFARNTLKSLDRARIAVSWTRLGRMYRNAAAIGLVNGAALGAFPVSLRPQCEVTGEWTDTKEYRFSDPLCDDTPVILFVGRLIPYKGLEYLLRALSQMKDRRWTLRIVGDGPLEASLKRECVELGLAPRVDFVGRVTREAVLCHYHDAAICCFPGLNESFGNVNVEAMSCGRPVVAAAWAGPKEIVTAECGFLVDVGSQSALVNGLADSLRLLLNRPGLRRSMGLAGRRRAVEVYDTSAVLGHYRQIHERVAGVV